MRATAAGALGLGALGLAGCAPTSGSDDGLAATGAGDVTFDEEYDVIVVGAGVAGLSAALTVATEGNGETCLLAEKGTVPGGNSPFSDNAVLYVEDADRMLAYMKDLAGDYPPSEAVLKAFSDGLATNLQWIQSLGVPEDQLYIGDPESWNAEFYEYENSKDLLYLYKIFNPNDKEDNKYLHQWMLEKAQTYDTITYQTNAPCEGLIQDPQSKAVIGAVIDGKSIKANKGVILCCGGFENSPELMENYLKGAHALPVASTLNTGECIAMCMKAGANLWHMGSWAGSWLAPRNLANDSFLVIGTQLSRQKIKAHGITVGINGRRFYMDYDGHNVKDVEDDSRYGSSMSQHVGHRHGHQQVGGEWPNLPLPSKAWFVFDQAGLEAGAMGTEFAGDPVADGWCVTANSIEELAAAIEVPADELVRTVNLWNKWCEEGEDLQYHRPVSTLEPVATGPFYAMMCVPTFLNTDGGPQRNENAQIVDLDGNPIQGLYSSGEFGSIWGHYYQGAGNLGECTVFGRIAAEHALGL